jgi:adenylate cyclase
MGQKETNARPAASAVQAREEKTASLSAREEVRGLCEHARLPGLGVGTAVSLGSRAARLQALGGFRETLVMESVREALRTTRHSRHRTSARFRRRW